jgi:hypothetical protein
MNTYGLNPTNTLASASFDVLKMDGIEDPLINVNKLATMDLEESYFSIGVAFINECRDEMTNHKITFYHSLQEATNEVAVLESFSDYYSKVKQVIDKFIAFIKNLVNKFIVAMMKFIKSDSYLTKHKKDFDNFSDEDKFTFDGFEYTFSQDIPSPTAALQFNNSLFDDLYASQTAGALSIDAVRTVIANMDLEKDYNEFRAKVIGKEGESIYVTEFSDALYEVYRNGDRDTVKIEADKIFIRRTLDRYTHFNTVKTSVERNRNDIEKAYRSVQEQVENIVKRNGDLNVSAFLNKLPSDSGITGIASTSTDVTGIRMSADFMAQLDLYVRAKVDQIQEYSNIHVLAFTAKLDAIKEAYNQDRSVLYTALSKIKVTDPEGGK